MGHKRRHAGGRTTWGNCGKKRHPSKGSARNHARRLHSNIGYEAEPYWCAACSGWHVGGKRERIAENRVVKENDTGGKLPQMRARKVSSIRKGAL